MLNLFLGGFALLVSVLVLLLPETLKTARRPARAHVEVQVDDDTQYQ